MGKLGLAQRLCGLDWSCNLNSKSAAVSEAVEVGIGTANSGQIVLHAFGSHASL